MRKDTHADTEATHSNLQPFTEKALMFGRIGSGSRRLKKKVLGSRRLCPVIIEKITMRRKSRTHTHMRVFIRS